YRDMTRRSDSGSSRSPIAVEPVTSQKATVTVLRVSGCAARGARGAAHRGAEGEVVGALPPAVRAGQHVEEGSGGLERRTGLRRANPALSSACPWVVGARATSGSRSRRPEGRPAKTGAFRWFADPSRPYGRGSAYVPPY